MRNRFYAFFFLHRVSYCGQTHYDIVIVSIILSPEFICRSNNYIIIIIILGRVRRRDLISHDVCPLYLLYYIIIIIIAMPFRQFKDGICGIWNNNNDGTVKIYYIILSRTIFRNRFYVSRAEVKATKPEIYSAPIFESLKLQNCFLAS